MTCGLSLSALARQPGANRRALCRRFGIAPTTGYKWLGRYAAEGGRGLQDRSRRPHRSPARGAGDGAAVLALRAQHPTWGARKLRVLLARQGVQPLPAASTLTAILRRHDALDPAQGAGQPRPGSGSSTRTPTPCGRWTSKRAGPAAPAAATPSPSSTTTRATPSAWPPVPISAPRPCAPTLTAFQRYGLPDRLLVDNGSPWGNHPAHPYTPLTVWLRRLGIAVSHSRPYHPQTLGKDERFHGTLQRDLGQPPRPDLDAWQAAFDAWRHEYNHAARTRAWPWRCPPLAITSALGPIPPSCHPCPTAPRTSCAGSRRAAGCRFRAAKLRLPKALRGQPVAFRPTTIDGCWTIRFLTDDLGTLDLREPA